MNSLKKNFSLIFKEQRNFLVLMLLGFVLGFIMFLISIFSINPNVSITKIGYGDIGGYKDGIWTDMLAFPIMSVLLGGIHPLISVRIFEKHGVGFAKLFSCISILLLFGLYVVFFRLVNEG